MFLVLFVGRRNEKNECIFVHPSQRPTHVRCCIQVKSSGYSPKSSADSEPFYLVRKLVSRGNEQRTDSAIDTVDATKTCGGKCPRSGWEKGVTYDVEKLFYFI